MELFGLWAPMGTRPRDQCPPSNKPDMFIRGINILLDESIFEASVKQKVNEKEVIQLTQYAEQQTLWNKWIESNKMCILLSYLLLGFCNLLQKHV